MPGRECYHCKQWIDDGEPHDCWTTTEAALTQDLSEDLQDAYTRLRETAAGFGEQRIYASHHSIMFARKACYFFVRPKKRYLEVCIFLPRTIKAPQVHKAVSASRVKVANMLRIQHRDEVESPLTDWLREAYELPDKQPASNPKSKARLQHKTKAGARTKAPAKKKKKKEDDGVSPPTLSAAASDPHAARRPSGAPACASRSGAAARRTDRWE